MCFLIIAILYCYDKHFPLHFWNHVGRGFKVPNATFPHICRRPFSSGFAMPKRSDDRGVSSACFSSPSVLRGDKIPTWSGSIIVSISKILGAVGVGWTWDSWRDGNNLENWFLPHNFSSADGVCITISLFTYGLGLLALWLYRKDKMTCCRFRVIYCPPLLLSMSRARSRTSAASRSFSNPSYIRNDGMCAIWRSSVLSLMFERTRRGYLYDVPFAVTLVLKCSIVIAMMDAGCCIDDGGVSTFGHPIFGPPSPLSMTYWFSIVDDIAPIIRKSKPTPNTSRTFEKLGMLTRASLGIVLVFSSSGWTVSCFKNS